MSLDPRSIEMIPAIVEGGVVQLSPVRLALGVAIILVMIGALIAIRMYRPGQGKGVFGRMLNPNHQRRMNVKESIRIGPAHSLVLTEIDGTEIIFAISPNSIERINLTEHSSAGVRS